VHKQVIHVFFKNIVSQREFSLSIYYASNDNVKGRIFRLFWRPLFIMWLNGV